MNQTDFKNILIRVHKAFTVSKFGEDLNISSLSRVLHSLFPGIQEYTYIIPKLNQWRSSFHTLKLTEINK